MKILFVVYRLDFADQIAIAYLSGIAKHLGHTTFFCAIDTDDFLVTLQKIKPDVVAYSVNIMGYQKIVEAHKRAMTHHNFVSIMGGPQATFSPETFAESGMDAYCIGEGEYAFRDFLVAVENKTSFDDIPNLITSSKRNSIRPLIDNLDDLPPADRDLTISNSFLKDTPKKTFYATRGCPFSCSYCCNNYYNEMYRGKGKMVRRFSVERLLREIEDVKSKYNMNFVKFGDDLFAMKADKWLEEFAEKYPRRIGVPFNCYLRFDRVDDDMLKLLKDAGCFSVHLSVDSTSEHVRENVLKRKMRSVKIVERLRKIREHGINTWVNFMLAAPESTLQDDLNTIRLCRNAKVTYPAYSTTVPMKGTELYNFCVNKKLIDPSTHRGDMTGCYMKSTLSCFSEKEKNIRYNIFLLGAVVSKLPPILYDAGILMIKHVPPNRIFKWIREQYYQYSIKHTIFKLT